MATVLQFVPKPRRKHRALPTLYDHCPPEIRGRYVARRDARHKERGWLLEWTHPRLRRRVLCGYILKRVDAEQVVLALNWNPAWLQKIEELEAELRDLRARRFREHVPAEVQALALARRKRSARVRRYFGA